MIIPVDTQQNSWKLYLIIWKYRSLLYKPGLFIVKPIYNSIAVTHPSSLLSKLIAYITYNTHLHSVMNETESTTGGPHQQSHKNISDDYDE